MFIDLQITPAGKEAEDVFQQWVEHRQLQDFGSGRVEVAPNLCFRFLVDLQNRCYDLDLSVQARFTGEKD